MTSRARRSILKLAAVALLASGARPVLAQSAGSDIAVPFYKPEDVVAGLYQHWGQPRAADFASAAKALQAATARFCSGSDAQTGLAEVRATWKAAATNWDRLTAVTFGPLIERRSVRAIDFRPTRPQLIERAIKQAPRGAAAMERIGTPAKGLPALEWLLWEQPVAAGSPACAYAVEVATDIVREAQALQGAFAAATPAEWDNERTAGAFTEFVNQWVGSVERLRWQEIERPVREAGSSSRSAARFPRSASGATAASWAAHWQGLRDLAVSTQKNVPQPGKAVIPIELYLHARGQLALAQRWKAQITEASAAMEGLAPTAQERLLPAAKALASVKRMAEEKIAPALNVSIGFSDADGD